MYSVFDRRYLLSHSIVYFSEFDLIKRVISRDISELNQYYQSRISRVTSQHLLCRLLMQAYASETLDIYAFADRAETRSDHLVRTYNLTSTLSYGKLHDSIFYYGCKELIIYDNSSFDIDDAYKNWKHTVSIRVLEHPVENMSLMLPDSEERNIERGLAVISVNIPKMLVQLRAFFESHKDNTRLGVEHFVKMYVLPKMLYSHTDLTLFNRLISIYRKQPRQKALARHPIAINDYSDKVDLVLEKVLNHISDSNSLYPATLRTIPTIVLKDMQSALLMPSVGKTRQVWWALLLTRLKATEFLIQVQSKNGLKNNGMYINEFKYDYQKLQQDSALSSVLDDRERRNILARIDNLRKHSSY